ncbi:iron hydrogenase small subunit [candidate division KSB1 bacterium]|nr:iron hydrogenase small subunit [candidate division KSB1 bacterium]
MMQIEVNNKKIQAEPGEMILTALKRAGIHVPTLCYLEKLPPAGRCRICVVEVEGRKDLVTACSTPVQENMKIKTHSPRVLNTRKKILELLLSNHPDDCLYCVRNGQCDLRQLADEMYIRTRDLPRNVKKGEIDTSSLSIVREPSKCILCGRCVRVCAEIQTVNAIEIMQRGSLAYVGIEDDKGMGESWCINCGQCVVVCPTGALAEKSHVEMVKDALGDPKKYVVVQHAPSISVTLAEEFGFPVGTDVDCLMVAAFRAMGFDRVFDTSFSADLTIMEEGSELVHRLLHGGKLPMMTSCSPGWVKFVEQFYPELTENVSTCKSPQQMMGAIIKSFFSERENIKPEDIFSVSIMPCTAKKFEANRPEMGRNGVSDVDAVLTTRELAELIRLYGIDFKSLKPEEADDPFGQRTTAGKIFGASGGVMEAALRSGYFLVTGKELEDLSIEPVRGLEGIREAKIKVNDLELHVAVTSGLGNARKLMDQVRAGRKDLHFIEIMTCPGGCIAGGGQPRNADFEKFKARAQSLYTIDKNEEIRVSHKNPSIIRLYDEFLGKPLGEKSHKLLHTHYKKRELYN